MTELEKKDYEYIDGLASQLKTGLQQIATDKGFKVQITGISSIFYPHFNSNPIRNMRDRLKDDAENNKIFCMGLIANSVYFPPHHLGATCFSHTQDDIDFILKVAEKVLTEMKNLN